MCTFTVSSGEENPRCSNYFIAENLFVLLPSNQVKITFLSNVRESKVTADVSGNMKNAAVRHVTRAIFSSVFFTEAKIGSKILLDHW